MSQIARNLTDSAEGLLTGKRYLIHDRDPLFTDEFLRPEGRQCGIVNCHREVRTLNAHAERFVRSIKECSLDRLILRSEKDPCGPPLQNYVTHSHSERNHQGLDNRIIQPKQATPRIGAIHRREQRRARPSPNRTRHEHD